MVQIHPDDFLWGTNMEEKVIKQGQRLCVGDDWVVEVGVDGNVSISFFQDNHFYSEILLNVKDGVKVIRYN